MKWEDIKIIVNNSEVTAIAPRIISASRSTDIPAFYAEWFVKRLNAGFIKWINPFNKQTQYVSLQKVKAIIFWTKNPKPLINFLPELDAHGIKYYFQFTVNDYEEEGLEPGVPPLLERIETFKLLSNLVGKDLVIWRFDPLIRSDKVSIQNLVEKINRVGELLAPYTSKLVFSFADITRYRHVQLNLKKNNIEFIEFSNDEIEEIGFNISKICTKFGIQAATCGEAVDLSQFNIIHNKCIDDRLLKKITRYDQGILKELGASDECQLSLFENTSKKQYIKDPGQRKECGCALSKDIGQYNTCRHLCLYCYANYSKDTVVRNLEKFNIGNESII